MTNFWKSPWMVAATLAALVLPAAMLNAQGGRRGGGTPVANVPEPTSPVTGSAVAGKSLYYTFGCYACHGYNGETGARPFVGRWGNLSTEQAFLTFLRGRANVAPVTPSTSMPNFSAQSLSDKQAKDIYAYIRSFKSTKPGANEATALDAILNAAKQEKN